MKRVTRVFLMAFLLVSAVACRQQQPPSAESYYMQGKAYEQQGRTADALRQYQLAFGNGSDNSEYVRKSINAMGQLYLAAGRRDDALTQFRRSYDYAASSHDTVLMVLSLRDMSRCLRTPEWLPSAANCFERADQLITSAHLDSLRQQLLPEWIDVLTQLGRANTYTPYTPSPSPVHPVRHAAGIPEPSRSAPSPGR